MGIVAVVVFAGGMLTSATAQVIGPEEADHDADSGQVEEDEDDGGPQAPVDFLNDRFTSFQDVTDDQVEQAVAQAATFGENGNTWRLVGPSNIGGRVTGLVVDPRRPNTIYVAASGGGVWRSTDAAATFQPAWPSGQTQTLGSLAMGRDGTLWAGTGEANPSGGGLTYFGNGVYRSTDGGRSWDNWGLTRSGSIGAILTDPVDSRRVYVAATGNLSGTARQRGIYRLADNGRDWRLVLPTPNNTTGGVDLAMDPTNHNRIYAVLWDHQRNNGARVYGGVGSGLFRSDNAGETWTRLENVIGTAPTDQAGTGLRSDASLGRIGVVVAPNDPNRVYVVSATQYGPDKGFYVSNDGGTTFTPSGHAGGSSGYAWWFGRLWVDPKDENHLYDADVNLRESTDGGVTWHVSAGVHADQHAMQWDPNQPGRIYLGNDGGVYHSDTNGTSTSWVHATYEPFNQSYHLAVARDDPTRLATGLQDNGSVRTWTATTPPGDLTQWNAYGGGDGHEVLIDPTNHNTYYECSQVGSCRRHQDMDGTSMTINLGARHSTRTTTDAPIVLDPTNPAVVYFGGNVLDRSTDFGNNFTQISPPGDFLTGPVPPKEDDKGPFYANEYATITWIAPAKTDPNTIYLGTDTGRLWRTNDLGAHWTEFTGKGLPTRWVNAIVVDPTDARHVFVAFSGYREGDLAANIWETENGGRSWDNISGRLPNGPVEMLTYDQPRRRLYAATDLGVFVNRDGRSSWRRVGRGLPNTSVLDIKITGDGRTLYAATFGRSVWSVRIDD
ncbi:WD40/YVTN/BNR-like repeat-containing protein [Actinocrispum wychmicini]|uniref:WD40/YVTN/BNR-like repeat-containing protein n=1 Tax=Actinocrispum wychmicini TaxID=1213861 RepID=UPI00104D8F86|nr:sialidase family protein [Actinocrispum wychmicini]